MPHAVVHITSIDDPRVDVFRDVADADLRGRDDLFMAESELVLRRLLRTPDRIHSLLLSPQRYQRLHAEIDAALTGRAGFAVLLADLPLIHQIASFHVHRGVLAAGRRLPASSLTIDAALGHLRHDPAAMLLAAEGLTNVDNMGALFRNAAAFGVGGVLLDPTCCDPLYRKAIRVSMGHALSVPYAVAQVWPRDLARIRQWGFAIIAAESIASRSIPLWRIPRSRPVCLLFGSEGHGLSTDAIDLCDAVCEVPMHRDVPSINVAVASAVFLYELTRGE